MPGRVACRARVVDTHTPGGRDSLLQKGTVLGQGGAHNTGDGMRRPVTMATTGSCNFQKAGSAPSTGRGCRSPAGLPLGGASVTLGVHVASAV